MHRFLNDPTLAVPVFPGSHIAMDGHYLFLSGLTVSDIQGGEAVLGDIAEETRWVMRRLSRMLEYAGASMAEVVRVDIHLTNLDTIHTMDAAYAEFFENHSYPARTCTESSRLSGGANVEITLMARQPAEPAFRHDTQRDETRANGRDESHAT
ncbi:RidA family protein [Billgrantia pellis]|uniref:RidA family protein n=1 Tax=Billgrantia pellis TaxID=2606936 RepID=A0A7V7G285_9GAMM|nr:RidA family protein [Halomonas pellis]KAA0013828.1 RidA family protein [Halomonas pellis]